MATTAPLDVWRSGDGKILTLKLEELLLWSSWWPPVCVQWTSEVNTVRCVVQRVVWLLEVTFHRLKRPSIPAAQKQTSTHRPPGVGLSLLLYHTCACVSVRSTKVVDLSALSFVRVETFLFLLPDQFRVFTDKFVSSVCSWTRWTKMIWLNIWKKVNFVSPPDVSHSHQCLLPLHQAAVWALPVQRGGHLPRPVLRPGLRPLVPLQVSAEIQKGGITKEVPSPFSAWNLL